MAGAAGRGVGVTMWDVPKLGVTLQTNGVGYPVLAERQALLIVGWDELQDRWARRRGSLVWLCSLLLDCLGWLVLGCALALRTLGLGLVNNV